FRRDAVDTVQRVVFGAEDQCLAMERGKRYHAARGAEAPAHLAVVRGQRVQMPVIGTNREGASVEESGTAHLIAGRGGPRYAIADICGDLAPSPGGTLLRSALAGAPGPRQRRARLGSLLRPEFGHRRRLFKRR